MAKQPHPKPIKANPYAITDADEMLVTSTVGASVHPGPMIRDNIEYFGLTLTRAAKAIGTPLNYLSNIVNGKKSVSYEMALRLEAAFGLDADLVHGMSERHENAKLRARRNEIVAGIERIRLAA